MTLTVTDAFGNASTNTAEVRITVTDRLTVNAGVDQVVNLGEGVTLIASRIGRLGELSPTQWRQTSGTPDNISLNGATTSRVRPLTAPDAATTLEFTITATDRDGSGNQATDTVSVDVRDQNPPTAEAGDAADRQRGHRGHPHGHRQR